MHVTVAVYMMEVLVRSMMGWHTTGDGVVLSMDLKAQNTVVKEDIDCYVLSGIFGSSKSISDPRRRWCMDGK